MFETRRELVAAVSYDRTTCTRLHFARDANEKSCPVIYASIRSPPFRRPMICTFLPTTSCSRQKKMTRLIDVCGPIKPRCLLIQQRSGGPGSRHSERGMAGAFVFISYRPSNTPVAAKLVNGPWCKKNRWAPAHTGKISLNRNRDNKH